jgi:hypothetical protein
MQPNTYLTPSELVYLNGEKFAQKVRLGNTKLLHNDQDVGRVALVVAILRAALFTQEQYRTLRLEVRKKKVLLGLASTETLYADPVGPMPAWPEGTVEAALPPLAQHFYQPKGENEVINIIYAWLGQDAASPYELVLEKIKWGLARRGLLEVQEERKLKIFVSRKFICPLATLRLAAEQPLQPVFDLLNFYSQSRPDVWKESEEAIRKGVGSRQEKSDDSSSFD